MKEQLSEYHQSIRGYFAGELYNYMQKDDGIWVVTADLGYGMWDKVRDTYPDRFINTGASEQVAVGIALGLAEEKQTPIVYSITTFLLRRPFELIHNYAHHEQIPIKLVGSGRDRDYSHDGFSHWSDEAKDILNLWDIKTFWPDTKEQVPQLMDEFLYNGKPSFVSLRR